MEKVKKLLRKWLGIEMTAHICAAQVLEHYVKEQFAPATNNIRHLIQDLQKADEDLRKDVVLRDAEQLNYIAGTFTEQEKFIELVQTVQKRSYEAGMLADTITELRARLEDLEAAYPDYNKAKEQAEENKSKEIVPGFRPFTQRKRAWEAQHRKPAEKK